MRAKRADLLDVNVWLALADEDHVHHERAKRYWETEAAAEVSFCRLTMLALFRLLTNAKVMVGRPFSPREAWALYREFLAGPGVSVLAEPPGLEQQMAAWSDSDHFSAHRWTDCALAAWARIGNCRLVSFDGDYSRFEGLHFLHLQE